MTEPKAEPAREAVSMEHGELASDKRLSAPPACHVMVLVRFLQFRRIVKSDFGAQPRAVSWLLPGKMVIDAFP